MMQDKVLNSIESCSIMWGQKKVIFKPKLVFYENMSNQGKMSGAN